MAQVDLEEIARKYGLKHLDWLQPRQEKVRDGDEIEICLVGHGSWQKKWHREPEEWEFPLDGPPRRPRFELPRNMKLTKYARHGAMTSDLKAGDALDHGPLPGKEFSHTYHGGQLVPNYRIGPYLEEESPVPPKGSSIVERDLFLEDIVEMIKAKFPSRVVRIIWGACCYSLSSANRDVFDSGEQTPWWIGFDR